MASASSVLCSPPIKGDITCSSVQFMRLRRDLVHLPLTRHRKNIIQEQGKNYKGRMIVSADYNGRKGSGAGDFVAGFVLGGVICGALGYLFAPQVNKLLSTVDRERDEPSKKLPKGFDDDEGLEKTRRNLNEKIAQLNAAIDDVSAQLRADDGFTSASGTTTELETAS